MRPRLTDRVLRALLEATNQAHADLESATLDEGERGRQAAQKLTENTHAQQWVLGMIRHRKEPR